MSTQRKQYSAEFKARVALEALKGLKTVNELASTYGVHPMTAWLRSQGYHVNHKRVARLLQTMGLEAIYPTPHLSQGHPTHRVYPYLLRGVPSTRVHHVWSTDITYIRLHC